MRIYPCFDRIGTGSFEPTIGSTSDGAVFYHPAAPLGLPETVSTGRTRDEGATWDLLTPMIGPVPTHPYSQDPFIYVDLPRPFDRRR